jgi:hypothetical protein
MGSMDKKSFEQLSTDHKWIVVKEYLDIIKSTTQNRMSLLPTTSGLAAGLLVITSFKDSIPNMSFDIKIIITTLLFLIPFSLYLFNRDQKMAALNASKGLEDLNGKKQELPPQDLLGNLTRWMPDIIICILCLLSLILIVKLWFICSSNF